jgi:hypothetical protein
MHEIWNINSLNITIPSDMTETVHLTFSLLITSTQQGYMSSPPLQLGESVCLRSSQQNVRENNKLLLDLTHANLLCGSPLSVPLPSPSDRIFIFMNTRKPH